MYIAFIIGAFAVRDGARRNELEDFLQKILRLLTNPRQVGGFCFLMA
ncbi:hypothetical protein GSH06_22615 [Burkholderia pseudomallei]|nr:hypothetical protein [Burkholderia pseudomallei]MBM5647884.1 hypothetical protein [Burkholderia pseudomallei]